MPLIKIFAPFLFIDTHAVTAALLIPVNHHFFTRAAEHMGVSNCIGKRLKNLRDSALSDHLLQCNCTIDFDHFYVLPTDVNLLDILVK